MPDRKPLREQFLQQRKQLAPPELQQKCSQIAELARSFLDHRTPKTLMLYLSFTNEVDTWQLLRDTLPRYRVVVPYVEEKKLHLSHLTSLDHLVPGKFGIKEPAPEHRADIPASSVDVFFLPGLVFDQQGYRLGYGWGFFDRLLHQVAPPQVKIGLAYSFQVIEKLPHYPWDVTMDFIITESGIWNCHTQNPHPLE